MATSTTSNYNFFDPDVVADPYPAFSELREMDEAYLMPLTNWRLFTRYEDVWNILRDHEGFSSDSRNASNPRTRRKTAPTGVTMLGTDPPDHTRLRKLVSRDFTPRSMESQEERIREIVGKLLDETLPSGKIDVMNDLAIPLPVMVIAELLGIPSEDYKQFKEWSDNEVKFIRPDMSPEEIDFLENSSEQLYGYFGEQIRKARERNEPGDDLISQLVVAADDGDALSEQELVEFVVLLLLAGNETTTNLIGNGTLALLRHEQQMNQLRNNMDLLPTAIEEFLRFDGPVQSTFRQVMKPANIHGVDIEPGETIAVVLGAANRDPSKFDLPEELILDRKPNEHVAFGTWIHVCIGAPLARIEGRVAIEQLLKRTNSININIDENELSYNTSFALRGLQTLPVDIS